MPVTKGWTGDTGKGAAEDAGGGVGCSPPMDFWSRCLDLSWSLEGMCVVPTTAGAQGDSCTERSHLQTSPADADPTGHGLVSPSSSLHGVHQVFQLRTQLVSHHCLSLTLILTGKDALAPNKLGCFIGESERPTFIFWCGFFSLPCLEASPTSS